MRAVDIVVRAEWLAVAIFAVCAYAWTAASWWLFALLILAPDLSFAAYLAGPRAGAIVYNFAHSLIGPILLLAAGAVWASDLAIAVALVWTAHVAVDRALGYGLKLASGFRDTHLGRIGRD